ncbi:MAG: hypothetical protein KIT58_02150 [Planctomycetota bacterium]|nr:hypothetical protein [Planctomycetota bacterium]
MLTAALKVFPRDGYELLLVRGQARALLEDLEGARQDLVGRAHGGPPARRLGPGARHTRRPGPVLVLAGELDKAGPSLEAADAPPGHGPARPGGRSRPSAGRRRPPAATTPRGGGAPPAPRAGDAHYALSFVLTGQGDAQSLQVAAGALRQAARQGVDLELRLRALTTWPCDAATPTPS